MATKKKKSRKTPARPRRRRRLLWPFLRWGLVFGCWGVFLLLCLVGWLAYDLPDLRSVFGSDYTFPKGGNVVHYASPEADRLFDTFDRAEDWPSARSAMQTLHRRIHDDQPYTFLYESRRLAVAGPRLDGVVIDVPSDPLARLERFRLR